MSLRAYLVNSIVFIIAIFKLFYNTIATCQRPVGPLLSKCMCMYVCIGSIIHHAVQVQLTTNFIVIFIHHTVFHGRQIMMIYDLIA